MRKLFLILFFPLCWAVTDIVVSNYEVCSNMTKHYIERFDVTAAELTIILSTCEGILNPVNPGLAGGFHATIYHGFCKNSLYLDASVKAPKRYATGSRKRFADVGVPMMLKGYQYLYNMRICGKKPVLPWKDLFTENINLAKNGWVTTDSVLQKLAGIDHSLTINRRTKQIKNSKLAKTLERIAEDGPSSSMYVNNTHFQWKMMADLQANSFISNSDLIKAEVEAMDPFVFNFLNFTIVTTRISGSGSSLILGLKIIESAFSELQQLSPEKQVMFLYHTLRYAYSLKPLLRSKFIAVHQIIGNSSEIAFKILDTLDDTWDPKPIQQFGNYRINNVNHPRYTAKASVNSILIKRGMYAITMSTATNRQTGEKLLSDRLGMVYNNLLKDFDNPDTPNGPKGNKRPQSYAANTILYSKRSNPVFSIGTTAERNHFGSILNVMFHYFVNGKTLEEANEMPYCVPRYRNAVETVWCDEYISDGVKGIFDELNVPIRYSEHLHGGVTASSTVRNYPEAVFDVTHGGAIYVNVKEGSANPIRPTDRPAITTRRPPTTTRRSRITTTRPNVGEEDEDDEYTTETTNIGLVPATTSPAIANPDADDEEFNNFNYN